MPESGDAQPVAPSTGGDFSIPVWVVVVILALWVVTVFLGTVALTLPREGSFATRDGRPLELCSNLEGVDAPDFYLCTLDGDVVGPPRSDDVVSQVGAQILDWETITKQFGTTIFQPQFWLAVGLGVAAVLTLFVVARATGTLRAGLATSITLIVFGLLLFPGGLTAGLDAELRSEIINAWKVVVAFYFGSEAAVQAFKIFRPAGQDVTGDIPGKPSTSTTE